MSSVGGDGRAEIGDGAVSIGDGRAEIGDGAVSIGDGRAETGDGRAEIGGRRLTESEHEGCEDRAAPNTA